MDSDTLQPVTAAVRAPSSALAMTVLVGSVRLVSSAISSLTAGILFVLSYVLYPFLVLFRGILILLSPVWHLLSTLAWIGGLVVGVALNIFEVRLAHPYFRRLAN
jgi:hypothetical protein